MNYQESATLDLSKSFFSILVVMSHFLPKYFGLDFFTSATSGFFVIAGYYAFNFENDSGFTYLIKRLVRLYPLYLLAVLIYVAVKKINPSEDLSVIVKNITVFITIKNKEEFFSLNPAFWSMPVFISFYVLKSFIRLPVNLISIFLALISMQLTHIFSVQDLIGGYLVPLAMPLYLYAFILGGYVGKVGEIKLSFQKKLCTALTLLLILTILTIGFNYKTLIFFNSSLVFSSYDIVMVSIFSLLLYTTRFSKLSERSWTIVKRYSAMSFAVYLFHNAASEILGPKQGWFPFLTAIALTLLFSIAATLLIEKPARNALRMRLKSGGNV